MVFRSYHHIQILEMFTCVLSLALWVKASSAEGDYFEHERSLLHSFRHFDHFEGQISFPRGSAYLQNKGPNASLKIRGWMGGMHGIFAYCWHCYGGVCSSEKKCCGKSPSLDCFDGNYWRREVCCDKELQHYENHPELQTSVLYTTLGIEQIYQRLTARRLEHLTTLQLPIWNRSVLELAGRQGDLTHYFTDRNCSVTFVEPRKVNIMQLRRKLALGYLFPNNKQVNILSLDLEKATPVGKWQIVFCFGLLYHLEYPLQFLSKIAPLVSEYLLLETFVSSTVQENDEVAGFDSMSLSGRATVLRREDIFYALRQLFPYVYVPKTQPNHDQFEIDWTKKDIKARAFFIASRNPLTSPVPLMEELPMYQTRSV